MSSKDNYKFIPNLQVRQLQTGFIYPNYNTIGADITLSATTLVSKHLSVAGNVYADNFIGPIISTGVTISGNLSVSGNSYFNDIIFTCFCGKFFFSTYCFS